MEGYIAAYFIISIFTVTLLIITGIIFFYQYKSFQDSMDAKLHSIVAQINDINYLFLNINKIQDDNIMTMDSKIHS